MEGLLGTGHITSTLLRPRESIGGRKKQFKFITKAKSVSSSLAESHKSRNSDSFTSVSSTLNAVCGLVRIHYLNGCLVTMDR